VSVVTYRFRFHPYPALEYISEEIEQLTGYSKEEFYPDASLMVRIVVPQDAERARRYFSGSGDLRLMLRWEHLDGRVINTSHRLTPLYEGDQLVGMEGEATTFDSLDTDGV
jgi:hypothetical protein